MNDLTKLTAPKDALAVFNGINESLRPRLCCGIYFSRTGLIAVGEGSYRDDGKKQSYATGHYANGFRHGHTKTFILIFFDSMTDSSALV